MNYLLKRFKRKSFFEGWYFKHQAGNSILAFIPGYCTDTNGKSSAFIQIIMNESSCSIPFSIDDFSIDRRRMVIRLGKNIFSRKGIRININNAEIQIKGQLKYGKVSPIRYTIMGYFKYFPFMECKHEILSMYHKVYGCVKCNGRKYNYNPGTGYIEKDLGYSFPKTYQWIQCSQFPEKLCSVFLSIADIPYHGINFSGCICNILYQGREYRLATYLGVKILKNTKEEVYLKQGSYEFRIFLNNGASVTSEEASGENSGFSHELFAPLKGDMTRIIKEQHLICGRFMLYKKKKLIFDLTSPSVSYEYVD
jgi:hypothetical protein